MKIGFIGVGLMGAAMCERLLDKGYDLQVLGNRTRDRLEALVARGAVEAEGPKAIAEWADIVMLCVATSAQVESRMRGQGGVIDGLSEGKVVIDFGTSLPGSTRELGQEVAERGATYLDAPLGRTPMHAKEGLLNIMGSGDKAAFDRVKPVLDDLGENVFHLGDLGAGHTIKLLNNFFSQAMSNALAEAYAVADKSCVSRQALYDVMSAGPNHSGIMDFVTAYAIGGDPSKLAFSIKNAAKDVGYYAQMAEGLGVQSIMSKGPREALGRAIDDDQGERMVPEMVDMFSNWFKD